MQTICGSLVPRRRATGSTPRCDGKKGHGDGRCGHRQRPRKVESPDRGESLPACRRFPGLRDVAASETHREHMRDERRGSNCGRERRVDRVSSWRGFCAARGRPRHPRAQVHQFWSRATSKTSARIASPFSGRGLAIVRPAEPKLGEYAMVNKPRRTHRAKIGRSPPVPAAPWCVCP